MKTKIIQNLINWCIEWERKHPWILVLAVGVFALASNLTASVIWEGVTLWDQPWRWSGIRIFYASAFLITLIFLYLIAKPLFRVHATHKPAEERKHLILFLSFLGPDKLEMQQKLAQTCGVPDWLIKHIKFQDLSQDLDMMVEIKEKFEKKWPWEMPLRAINWHCQQNTLISISLIGSEQSIRQACWFLEICSKYPQLRDLTYYVVGNTRGRPQLLEPTSQYASQGWNFEVFDDLRTCLELHLKQLTKRGLGYEDIMIDFTGGQKVTSVVATSLTLNCSLKAQYIQTNHPYNAIEYDIQLIFADRGKLEA